MTENYQYCKFKKLTVLKFKNKYENNNIKYERKPEMNILEFKLKIQKIINEIDKKIGSLLNKIIHHSRFQQLESSWRGLFYLVNYSSEYNKQKIRIKILTVSWNELAKDLSRAGDFDQSQMYLKIHNDEFGRPGGEAFSLLIGDYYISHRGQNFSGTSDIHILQGMAKIAAISFCPFITSISPIFFGLNSFKDLDRIQNFDQIFQNQEYNSWKSLRQDEDARFLGLTLPQVLMRQPYNQQQNMKHPFIFTEDTSIHENLLWGNSSYCFAAVCVRAFANTGWFADIRGAPHDSPGGRIYGLPVINFSTDQSILALKASVNACITDQQEKILNDLGLIPITVSQKSAAITFYECSSIQMPKSSRSLSTVNELENSKLSCLLSYILCISHFAHYLKIIARNKIGTFTNPEECQYFLQDWLHQYTADNIELSEELKIKYPLREAQVKIYEKPGSQGCYYCTIHLSPHYQFDQIQGYLEFRSELIRQI